MLFLNAGLIYSLGKNGVPEKVTKIKVIQDTIIGSYVADSNDIALYIFELDTYNKSNCVSASCVQVWPPFIVDSKNVTFESVTGTIDYITREDGKIQVTLNQWPLYYYKGEVDIPRSRKCQGIFESGGLWFLISPNGKVNFQTKEVNVLENDGILRLSNSVQFGSRFLTDNKGVTLYMFEKDSFLKSSCFSTCETVWPVYGPSNEEGDKFFTSASGLKNIASDQSFKLTIGKGLDSTLISLAKRNVPEESKTKYVYTYNGWPLYYYKGEKGGDAEIVGCQNIKESGGFWWIINNNGDVITQSTKTEVNPKLVTSWSAKMLETFKSLYSTNLYLSLAYLSLFFMLALA